MSTETLQNQATPVVAPPVAFLGLATGTAVMGMTLLTPALPIIREGFQTTGNAVQNLVTFYFLALAIGQLLAGTLSDRYGRKPVLVFGAVCYLTGAGAAVVAPDIESLTFFRAVQGVGAAACLSMGRAIINDCFERQAAARTMSTVQTIQAVVPMLSLSAGGFIAEHYGWQGSFSVMTIAGLILFLLALKFVTETNLQRIESIRIGAIFSGYRSVLCNPVFNSFAMTSAMTVGGFFALNAFLPYQYQRLGVSSAEFGLWFALTPVCYFLGNNLNRLYFVHRGIERAAMLGTSLILISTLLMLWTQTQGFPHPLALALPCMLYGLANGIVVGNATIGAINAAGRYAGIGSGLAGALQMTCGGLFGTLIIALGGVDDFTIAGTGMVLIAMVGVVSASCVFRRRGEL